MTTEKNRLTENMVLALAFPASAVMGFACIVVPVFVLQVGDEPIPLWPIGPAIGQIRFFPSLFGLFVTGMVLGHFQPRYWHLLGFSTVVLLPLVTAIEMFQNSSSHNLWPIEVVLYGFYAIPGFVGAAIGGVIGRRYKKMHNAGKSNQK